MKISEHEEISLKMFGRKCSEVHHFIDSYSPKYGPYHRIVLHHQRGVDLIVRKFEGQVRKVAEQHIIDDLGSIPNDWREFDFDLQNADSWLSKKARLPEDSIRYELKKLYPDLAHLLEEI